MKQIIEDCKTRPLKGKYKTYLLDEVHMLSISAWNAMLKILEEPPEYVIFLFCTTDPQKIIGTIMSRVQRFNFQRISVNGIVNRLKYVINQENIYSSSLQQPLIQYEEDALNYIARLAKGGMRDSITTLEKCLDYDLNLTLDNVLKVTSGSVSENELLTFLTKMLNKDCKSALILLNQIFMSGVDMSLFLRLYIEFLNNCTKYLITRDMNLTTISTTTMNWLEQHTDFSFEIKNIMYGALSLNSTNNNEDIKILLESWIIKICS